MQAMRAMPDRTRLTDDPPENDGTIQPANPAVHIIGGSIMEDQAQSGGSVISSEDLFQFLLRPGLLPTHEQFWDT